MPPDPRYPSDACTLMRRIHAEVFPQARARIDRLDERLDRQIALQLESDQRILDGDIPRCAS